jgi:hypothetical protein
VLQELLQVGAVRRVQRDAETGVDGQRHPGESDLLGHRCADPAQQRQHLVRAGAGQDQPELVTAETGHRVLGPHAFAQPAGDDLQQLVSGVVTEGVVDLLEAIEVDEREGDVRPVAPGPVEYVVGPGVERRAVRQAGESVVPGFVLVAQGLPPQRPGGRPGDQPEHDVQAEEAGTEPLVGPYRLAVQVGGHRFVRQVELENADRAARRAGDDRLQHPDDLPGRTGAVRDDVDVGPPAGRRLELGRRHRHPAGGGPVVGEHHPAGEAAHPHPDHRTVEDRQVGCHLQPIPLLQGETRGQVGTLERRGDRHLLDDRGLRQTLVPALSEGVLAITVQQDTAEHPDRDQAGAGVGSEEPRTGLGSTHPVTPESHVLPSAGEAGT